MSTLLLYHAFGLPGCQVHFHGYSRGSYVFHAEVTSLLERCPLCRSLQTVGRRAVKKANFG